MIPMFFVVISRFSKQKTKPAPASPPGGPGGAAEPTEGQ
jgi:multidrug efflux pump